MLRHLQLIALLFATVAPAETALAQKGAAPRFGWQPSQGNAALRPNTLEANKPVAMTNKIIQPVPLSADSQRHALASIDKNVTSQIASVAEKLKGALPDELAMLTKTSGWTTEDQQALVGALRAGDPTAVYETWVKGNPRDIAGAELAAHQTDARRLVGRLSQDIEKNKAGLKQDVADFDVALSKIAGATPAVAELGPTVKNLKTWIEARQLIEAATPGKGPVAKLPNGNNVTLVFDPALARGVAIVLSDEAILIGHEGDPALTITTGNAAEALGLPIVTGTPLAEEEGVEVTDGVLLVNPANSQGTLNYNINGNHYVAEPGMSQKLAPRANGREWVVEFDRGATFGSATYKLAPGTYNFTPTDQGWQLYRQRFEVVLDNSQSDQEFNYIFRGEDQTVPAGGSRTLSSTYPIVVRFDRGNGSDFVTKSTSLAVGNLQIGVNPTDNLWDLFPTSANHREASNLKPFDADRGASVK
jgi:hypothetical protein